MYNNAIMEDLKDLENYLKKLQRVVINDADINFFGKSFIKKNKIDDVWCCVLASLPEIFKKNLKGEFSKKLNSTIAYNHLFIALKQRCFFSSQMYSIKIDDAVKSISAILASIEKDIVYLEKNS